MFLFPSKFFIIRWKWQNDLLAGPNIESPISDCQFIFAMLTKFSIEMTQFKFEWKKLYSNGLHRKHFFPLNHWFLYTVEGDINHKFNSNLAIGWFWTWLWHSQLAFTLFLKKLYLSKKIEEVVILVIWIWMKCNWYKKEY